MLTELSKYMAFTNHCTFDFAKHLQLTTVSRKYNLTLKKFGCQARKSPFYSLYASKVSLINLR